MDKKNIRILLSILTLFFILTSCYYNPIKYIISEGEFPQSKADPIRVDYTINSDNGFYASLDFELTSGKVDWEIVNPKDEPVFKGYVVYEDGKVYRELTFPSKYLGGQLNIKEEVKNEKDTNGNIIKIPDFSYLQFEAGSIAGEYKLYINPINAEGTYKMEWSDRLPRK